MDKYNVELDEEKVKTGSTSKNCPECGRTLDPSTPNYCEDCGTRPFEKRQPEKK